MNIKVLSFFLLFDTVGLVTTQYSSELSTGSEQFCRMGDCSESAFYYQSFLFNVSIAGSYSFQSKITMKTFGYLFSNSFNPIVPSQNVIASNKDDGEYQQFGLYTLLDTGTTYILVVTTYYSGITGPFAISETGSTPIIFSPINTTGKSCISLITLLECCKMSSKMRILKDRKISDWSIVKKLHF